MMTAAEEWIWQLGNFLNVAKYFQRKFEWKMWKFLSISILPCLFSNSSLFHVFLFPPLFSIYTARNFKREGFQPCEWCKFVLSNQAIPFLSLLRFPSQERKQKLRMAIGQDVFIVPSRVLIVGKNKKKTLDRRSLVFRVEFDCPLAGCR
jgi:hypothetical protein